MTNIREAAELYLTIDLPIIPLCSYDHKGCGATHRKKCKSPGKAPMLKNWSKHKHTTQEDVQNWFNLNPNINIGLVLGETENWNLLGIDVDGELGENIIKELSSQYDFPFTWEYTTGNGRRLLYLLPEGFKSSKTVLGWDEDHQELAFICQGQQTVIPPSIHPSGKIYSWVKAHDPTECDIAYAPNWMLEKIKESSTPQKKTKRVTADDFDKVIPEGQRTNHMTRLIGQLCAKRTLTKDVILTTALVQNQKYFQPPLEEDIITEMVENLWISEQENYKEKKEEIKKEKEKKHLPTIKLAELFLTYLNNEGWLWRYNQSKGVIYETSLAEGPWKAIPEDIGMARISKFLIDFNPSKADIHTVKTIWQQCMLLSLQQFGNCNQLNLGENKISDKYIVVQNGMLNWREDKLEPWRPETHITTNIKAKWNKDSIISKAWETWTQALYQWLPEEDTIKFLQEYVGYCLTSNCKMRTALFLTGGGSNGKSLFMDIISLLFEDYLVTTTPEALSSRFGTTCLIDKMLAVCSDIDSTYLEKTGTLKQIIAGDRVRGEYKGGKDFDFVPTCKLLFSANKLPSSGDKTYGWYSRLQIVDFPYKFANDPKYYRNLITTMDTTEGRSALLCWAVEGLQRLEQQGHWTISTNMQTDKNTYRNTNDNVLEFADECLQIKSVDEPGKKENALIGKTLYKVYGSWCESNGYRQVSQREFNSRIQQKYETKKLGWKIRGKWRTYLSFTDIEFKDTCSIDAKQDYLMLVNTME